MNGDPTFIELDFPGVRMHARLDNRAFLRK